MIAFRLDQWIKEHNIDLDIANCSIINLELDLTEIYFLENINISLASLDRKLDFLNKLNRALDNMGLPDRLKIIDHEQELKLIRRDVHKMKKIISDIVNKGG